MKKLTLMATVLLCAIMVASSLLIITLQPKPKSFNVTYWKQQPDQLHTPIQRHPIRLQHHRRRQLHPVSIQRNTKQSNHALAIKYPVATMTLDNSNLSRMEPGGIRQWKIYLRIDTKKQPTNQPDFNQVDPGPKTNLEDHSTVIRICFVVFLADVSYRGIGLSGFFDVVSPS